MTVDRMVKSVHYQRVDPGIKWVKDTDLVINSNGPLDAERTLTPNVVRIGDGYRLYYHGFGPERPNPKSKGYILSAFSKDGNTWGKEPGIRIDAGGDGAEHYIWSPDVIPLADGGYRMYYEGKTEQADGKVKSAIVSALSTDGLLWEKEPGMRLVGENTSFLAPRCLYLDQESGNNGPRYRLYASSYPILTRLLPREFSTIAISSVQLLVTASYSSWNQGFAFLRIEPRSHMRSMPRKFCA